VKVVLTQKNQLEKITMDKAFFCIYPGLIRDTVESRPLAHIQMKRAKIIIPIIHNTYTYSELLDTLDEISDFVQNLRS